MVLGTVSAASGLGGSVLCLAQTAVMEKFGTWRASFMLCGIGILLGGVLIFLFIRNEPKEMGLSPYGAGEEITGKKKKISQNAKKGLTMKNLFRRPSFYMMIFLTFLSCSCVYVAFLVILPFFEDQGFSKEQASYLNSYLLLALAASKFVMGIIIDRIGAKKVTFIFHIFVSLGLVLLCVSKSLIVGIIALTAFAIGIPLITINIPLLSFTLFGYKSQAQYTGIFMGMISAASMITNIITNHLFDTFHTYSYGFLVAAALSLLLMGGYWLLYRMVEKDPTEDPE
jgi:sugar phosphate permease